MSVNFNIRRMQPSDSQALAVLEDKTTDTGRIGFRTSYRYDYFPIQQALRTDFTGIVAEVPGQDELVGVGLMSFGKCQVEGEICPFAYLGGLGVHEDFRRQGIASALAARRIELARHHIGPDGIIIAGVQGGNEGSLKTALKWANQTFENRSGVIIGKTLSNPPRPVNNLTIRPAIVNDLEEITQKQNSFYAEANLYPQKTAKQLRDWLAERPFEKEINRYYVAVDQQGNIQAGIGVTREGFLLTSHIVRMPRPLRVINSIVKLVPVNGSSKRLNGHWFWYQPGQEQAGEYLWHTVRWLERENATIGMLFYDQAGPVKQAISPPRFLPKSGGYILVNSPVPLSEDRPLYFNSMMA